MAELASHAPAYRELELELRCKYDPLNARFDIRAVFLEDNAERAPEWHTLRGDQMWELKQLLAKQLDDLAVINEHRWLNPAEVVVHLHRGV